MRQFQNQTSRTEVVYDRSGNPVEVRRGQRVAGDEFAKYAPPLTEIDIHEDRINGVILTAAAPAIGLQQTESEPVKKTRKGGRKALNKKVLVPESQ